ncbi:DUF4384 domain-containing protein [uncultured Propionivibrio sp.]|uniref:DUF4384 domain-containing protein n=1 Tax=uncultured Propionivibrio sp. TaxID=426737 RepID=UPI0029BFC335|nr:DUF4384 domain-containing protein [uncultured Propionivibrio sp.]
MQITLHRLIVVLAAIALLCPVFALAQGNPPPRVGRHALIIAIGQYGPKEIPMLEGVRFDVANARKMARAMAVPDENIVYLRDGQATADAIRAAIAGLERRIAAGDRVFIYYSGHGTRWLDASSPQNYCVEGLLASDGRPLSNQELGGMLKRLAQKTDKLFVFYDACFSGGVATAPFSTRSLQYNGRRLTPKFTPVGAPESCSKPSNFSTRSLALVMREQGNTPENVVHIAAARPDEVSFDNPEQGGFATVAWSDCLFGEARDIDGSGAVTVSEVTQCAQNRLNKDLVSWPGITGQNMVIGGNADFVPGWIAAEAKPAPVAPAVAVASAVSAVPVVPAVQAPPVVSATPARVLEEIYMQRDAARALRVDVPKSTLKIGADAFELSITANRDGYLYLVMAGSDNESLYLLYPNALDGQNAIKAGETRRLPRPGWAFTAGGPVGEDTILVMLTDTPRDLSRLRAVKEGPFLKSLRDAQGNSLLQQTIVLSGQVGSDAFGAALIRIGESP